MSLLADPTFEVKRTPAECGKKTNAWEVSTLPLSYTRQNRASVTLKVKKCKERVPAFSKRSDLTDLLSGYQLLQPGTLLIQDLELFCLLNTRTAVLFTPPVVGLFGDPNLPADLDQFVKFYS